MSDFAADIKKWVAKTKQNAELVFQNVAQETLTRIKERTPVKTGYLRANWVVTTSPDAIPVQGTKDEAALNAEISDAKIGETIFIVNPVVYARRIEYGFNGKDSLGRSYHQMGHHMVAQTMAEIKNIVDKVVNGMK